MEEIRRNHLGYAVKARSSENDRFWVQRWRPSRGKVYDYRGQHFGIYYYFYNLQSYHENIRCGLPAFHSPYVASSYNKVITGNKLCESEILFIGSRWLDMHDPIRFHIVDVYCCYTTESYSSHTVLRRNDISRFAHEMGGDRHHYCITRQSGLGFCSWPKLKWNDDSISAPHFPLFLSPHPSSHLT